MAIAIPLRAEVEARMADKGLRWITNVANPCGYKEEIPPRETLESCLKHTNAVDMIATLRERGQGVEVDYAFETNGNFYQQMCAIYASPR